MRHERSKSGKSPLDLLEPVAEGLVSGLVVSLYFAVLLGMIRFDRDMTDVVLGEQGSEQAAAGVAPVVVCHDLGNVGDAFWRKAARARAVNAATVVPFPSGNGSE